MSNCPLTLWHWHCPYLEQSVLEPSRTTQKQKTAVVAKPVEHWVSPWHPRCCPCPCGWHPWWSVEAGHAVCPGSGPDWSEPVLRELRCLDGTWPCRVDSGIFTNLTQPLISTNLYASLWFRKKKDGAEPRWLHQLFQCMLASPKPRTKGGGNHVLLFLFIPSSSRYGCKHEGHPCMEKGINVTVSTI